MATSVRQRFSLSQDFGGEELGLGPVSTPAPSGPAPPWRRNVENLLWVAAAAFAIYYGDSRHNLFHILICDPRVHRIPFYLGLVCLAVNSVIFIYLAVWLRHILKTEEKWELIAPAAIPTATLLGLLSFILFSIALWPIWSFLTLLLLFTLFMAFVVISPYIPPYARTDGDSLRSD